jgi:transketolase
MIDIQEGNNIEAIIAGMTDAKSRTERKTSLCVITEMGNELIYDAYCLAWKAPMMTT